MHQCRPVVVAAIAAVVSMWGGIASVASAQINTAPIAVDDTYSADTQRNPISLNQIILSSTTTGVHRSYTDIEVLGNDNFVAVWSDGYYYNEIYSPDVTAQLFTAEGVRIGSEFTVQTTGTGYRIHVADIGNDRYVIVWQSSSDGDYIGIRGRIFSYDGTPLGEDFVVNTLTSGAQLAPHVAGLSDGGFVVSWMDQSVGPYDIKAQRFSSSGAPVGAEFTVNSTSEGYQYWPRVEGLANGGFFIVWQDGDAAVRSGIRGQLFASDGTAVGSEILINSSNDSDQRNPFSAELPGGKIMVVWEVGRSIIRARIFSADGAAISDEFLVDSGSGVERPRVRAASDGFIYVAWLQRYGSSGVFARRFDTSGNPIGGRFSISDDPYILDTVAIESLPMGRTLFGWTRETIDGVARHPRAAIFGAPPIYPNSTYNFSVLENDTDADNDALTITAINGDAVTAAAGAGNASITSNSVTLPSGAGAALADGGILYDPTTAAFATALPAGATGNDTFTYTISDGALTDTANVTVTVTGVNDPPFLTQSLGMTVDEDDGPKWLNQEFEPKVSDPDTGDTVSLASFDASNTVGHVYQTENCGFTPTRPCLFYDDNGQFETLALGQSATDSVDLVFEDQAGAQLRVTLGFGIRGANDAPVATDDALATTNTVSLDGNLFADNGSGTDSDIDTGDSFTVTAINGVPGDVGTEITLPSGALATIYANGAFSYDPNGAFDLTPGATTQDSFTYTIADGIGATASATVTINLTGNSAPDAVDDAFTVLNSSDFGEPPNDPTLIYAGSETALDVLASHSTGDISYFLVREGQYLKLLSFNFSTNSLEETLLLSSNYSGRAATMLGLDDERLQVFLYSYDTREGLSRVVVRLADFAVEMNTAVGPFDSNDSLPISASRNSIGETAVTYWGASQSMRLVIVGDDGGVVHSEAFRDGEPSHAIDSWGGQVAVDEDGNFLIAWNQYGEAGTQNIFDINSYFVRFDRTDRTFGPITMLNRTSSIPGDQYLPSFVFTERGYLAFYSYSDVTAIDLDRSGAALGNPRRVLTWLTDGELVYGHRAYGIAENELFSLVRLGSRQLWLVRSHVSTPADPLDQEGFEPILLTDALYGPNNRRFWPATVSGLNHSAEQNLGPYIISWISQNSLYSVRLGLRGIDANRAATLPVISNDSDPDNDVLSITRVNGEAIRSASARYEPLLGSALAGPVTLASGAVVSLGHDALSYDPTSAGFATALPEGSTGDDTFNYTITDGELTDTANVTVTLTGVNDAPSADADALTANENDAATDVTAALLDGDTDPDTGETAQLAVSAIDTAGTQGLAALNAGVVTYTPNGAFEALAVGQTANDSFGYTVSDPGGLTATAAVTITVQGENDPPVADADTLTFGEEEAARDVTATLLNGDSDPDNGETAQLAITAVDTTLTLGHVTLTNGVVTYDPNGAFNALAQGQTANDRFDYTISDPHGATATATATLTINGFNGYQLTVSTSGLGAGTVTSLPLGINCGGGGGCTALFTQNTNVALSALVAPGTTFEGWSGDCLDPTQPLCVVPMSANRSVSARFSLTTVPEGRIVAATLPGARSGYVGGNDITVFMSVVSRATTPAQACRVTAPNDAPFTLTYRQINAQNEVVGAVNPLFDLPNGGGINFVVALTPTQTTPAAGYVFLPQIACENADLAPLEGVNSVLVSIGAAPVPDILSIGATPSADGVVRIPATGNRINFLSAAAVNIGTGDGSAGANEATVTASVDTGAASLPVTLEVCETAPTGGCLSPRGETTVTTVFAQNVAKFFAVFVRANGEETVPFNPANARVFLRFADASGAIRSVTSAAISAPAPANDAAEAASLTGRWSVLVRQPSGDWPSLRRASLYVFEDGTAILDDGASVTTPTLESLAADNQITRFELSGHQGLTREAAIQSGDALSDEPGALWGVRDARSDTLATWSDMAGDYGSLHIGTDGAISGTLAGCIVNGAPQDRSGATGLMVANVTLTACDASGRYTAVINQPANDNDAPALVIGGANGGWRMSVRPD